MEQRDLEGRSARARVIAATEGEIVPEERQTVRGGLSDFIYHRKLPIIAVTFVLVLAAFSVGSFFLRGGRADVNVLYAGPATLYADSGIDHALRSVRTGDRSENVTLSDVVWYSDADIAALGGESAVDEGANARALARFREEMTNGDAVLLMLSPALYEEVKGSLVPLSEIFDKVPPSAADGYSLRLGDTDFYKFLTSVQALPEDTRLCLRRASSLKAFNESRAAQVDIICKELLRDVAEFEAPLEE